MTPTKNTAPTNDSRGGIDQNNQVTPESTDEGETWVEHSTVGAVLIKDGYNQSNRIADRILDMVRDDDFADPLCRFVIKTARRMRAEAVPVDPVTMTRYVNEHGLLGAGPTRQQLGSRLHRFMHSCPNPVDGQWYTAGVIGQHADRVWLDGARRMADLVHADLAERKRLLWELVGAVLAENQRAIDAGKAAPRREPYDPGPWPEPPVLSDAGRKVVTA